MITTQRLFLRPWMPEDAPAFSEINADPDVMKFFVRPLSREESDASIERFNHSISQNGFGFWAVEIRGDSQDTTAGQFIGFIGLNSPIHELPFSPCVEIGWRLAKSAWRQGYASEGARACLDFAFTELKLERIVSMTPVQNLPSIAVMESLGMVRQPELFSHPAVPKGHQLEQHVWYEISRSRWRQS